MRDKVLGIDDCGLRIEMRAALCNPQSAIRNQQSFSA